MPDVNVTQMLQAFSSGDAEAAGRVLPHIYHELWRIAQARLGGERDAATLTPGDLVHEAYLRLVEVTGVEWQNRAHFYALAATVMRRLLVERARARRAGKRGGGLRPLPFGEGTGEVAVPGALDRTDDLLALDECLDALAQRSARQARVVECRYFGGLTFEETADALGVSVRTAKQDWRLARAWILVAMRDADAA